MGLDGMWFDMGASIDNEIFLDWETAIKSIRSKNPYCTIESNPGAQNNGYVLQYPYTDVVTYEARSVDDVKDMMLAKQNYTQKKMAIAPINLLEYNWDWKNDSPRSL
jgi:hypothetical protein